MFAFVEKLLIFLIAASLVIQLAPNESYKKCMKFFSGVVLILSLTNFLVGIFSKENIDLEDVFNYHSDIWKYDENHYEGIFNEYYGNLTENESN